MGTTEVYAWVVLGLSVLSMVMTAIYLLRAAHAYRVFHDERAAVSLGKAVGLMVVALGLTVSAAGLIVGMAILSTAGLSIARGALLVLMLTLILSGVRPDSRGG
jgi:tryptophan-rich sensory protein